MKSIRRIGLTAVVAAVSITGVTALVQRRGAQSSPTEFPRTVVASPVELVFAQPFELDRGYVHHWRAEKPIVSSGYLVVVRAEPELLLARQTHNPLLFFGAQTAERINVGNESGHLVALVPAGPSPSDWEDLDLHDVPIFFGKPNILPESLSTADIRAQVAKAERAGVRHQPRAVVDAALERAGGTVYLPDNYALYVWAADVIERYSPQESDFAEGLRVPLVR